MKACIYVRVSSSRQVSNTSSATQETLCRKWCDDHEIEVDRVFVEAEESAKSDDRTQFQKLFRYLETVGDRVSHLVVWKLDRFSRDSGDAAVYSQKLRKGGVTLVSVTEPIDATPMGRAMFTVAGAFNQLDNEVRAARSLVSMRAKFMAGTWTWSAPIGYRTVGKRPEIDPVRGPLIVRMFEMIASGQAKKSTALEQLTNLGLRTVRGGHLNQQTVARLLTNQLYAGRMYAKKWDLRVKGDFTPLLSEDLFDRVQDVLSGRASVVTPHLRQHATFPLKGSLLCNVCNRTVTGSISTGKIGMRAEEKTPEREKHKHAYYRCFRVSGHFNERADKVEKALEDLLTRMEPDPDRLAAAAAIFRAIWLERTAVANIEVDGMKKELKRLEGKEARLVDSLGDGVITPSAYKRATEPLNAEMNRLRQELASQKFDVLDVDDAVSYLQVMYWNLLSLYESNSLEGKSSLLKLLFPQGVTYRNGVLEPISTSSLFSSLGDKEMSESALASPTGFEPVSPP